MVIGTPRRKQTNPHKNSQAEEAKHTEDKSDITSNDDVDSNHELTTDEGHETIEEHNDVDDEMEPWCEWLRRATHEAEEKLQSIGVEDWVVQQRRRKWRWTHRIATQEENRWSRLVLYWQPYSGVGRTQGHPCTRLTDQLEDFSGGDWKKHAEDEVSWSIYEDAFVHHCG